MSPDSALPPEISARERSKDDAVAAGAGSGFRCLLISGVFPPIVGGSAVVYHNIMQCNADSMVGLGPRIDYVSGEPIQGVDAFDSQADYQIHRVARIRPDQRRAERGFWGALLDKIVEAKIRATLLFTAVRLIRKEKITVVCIGELIACGWLMSWLRRFTGVPQLVYVHGEDATVRSTWHRRRRRRFLKSADRIVAVSGFTRDVLVDQLGVPAEKVSVIHNGVDLARFRQQPDAERLSALKQQLGADGRTIVLSVGRLVERKGFDNAIRAIAKIIDKHPNVLHVVLGDGPQRAQLKALSDSLQLSNHVHFTGMVSNADLIAYYALADLFLLPNRDMPDGDTEGFGLVFLEANAAGKAVISGRAGGVLDAVIDGENGLTVNGHDPDAIAEAVDLLISDDSLRQRLALQGGKRAERSSWAAKSREFAELCRRMTRERHANPTAHGPTERALMWPRKTAPALPRDVPPQLVIVVDTEEEFDWNKPFSRSNTSVECVKELPAVHALMRRYGVRPVYVVDYPIVDNAEAVRIMRDLMTEGSVGDSAEIGAHLQPWVNPPHEEAMTDFNSFTCNLSGDLQRRKLGALTEKIETELGVRPRVYKAGRYGVGAQTPEMLHDLGFLFDSSVVPYTDYSVTGGPDFSRLDNRPFWFGPDHSLLEIPMTRGFTGLFAPFGRWMHPLSVTRFGRNLHLAGIMARSKLLNRITLTPEGVTGEEMIALTRRLVADGQRVFCLSFHSSTLLPGSTEYVRDQADYDVFVGRIERYLDVFMNELGGQPTGFVEMAEQLRPGAPSHAQAV